MTARDTFRRHVAETLTQWRLGCIPPRSNWDAQGEIFRCGLADILALRLRIAYTPLLTGLTRIENRVAVLCDLRLDHYAPPSNTNRWTDGYQLRIQTR